MKKIGILSFALVLMMVVLTGCGGSDKAAEQLIDRTAVYLKKSSVAKDRQRMDEIVCACQVAMAVEEANKEALNNIPIVITVTKDGGSVSPSTGLDKFMEQFNEVYSDDINESRTYVKTHKIVVTVGEKGKVTGELLDTETGEPVVDD